MENSYFSEEHGINQIKVNKPKKKTVSVSTFIVSLIMVAALVSIVFLKWNDIMWFFWVEEEIDDVEVSYWLSVWDEVAFSGSISADWDMENYTHSYMSKEYWEIWLKSKNLILNNYSDNVYFEWVVERIYHDMPIVLVTTIYNLENDESESTGDTLETWDNEEIQVKYLPNLWLYFGEEFFKQYSLLNDGDWSILKIKNLETNIISSINYFKCDKASQSSENCEYLNNLYATASSSKLVDKYGVSYYKDPEVNSWFFSNDSMFGYKINDEDESLVRNLSTLMVVVNKNFVEKNVLSNVWSLCKVDHSSIEKVEKSELSYKNSNFYYLVEWLDSSKNKINCELKVDPTLTLFAQVVSVNIEENKEDAEKHKEDSWNTSTWVDTQGKWEDLEPEKQAYIRDSDVEQFPINLEKTLTFTSSRGHSFIFPSSKIAYQWRSSSENFWQVWVNCFSAMNVVKYEDKELVETQWNVVIYECNVKDSFDDSDKTLIYRNVGDKHFVIQINDPARVDFANNIEIVA